VRTPGEVGIRGMGIQTDTLPVAWKDHGPKDSGVGEGNAGDVWLGRGVQTRYIYL
jgi:hypothetical protein